MAFLQCSMWNLFFTILTKIFRCGMVPFIFDVKVWYLARRINRSKTLSVKTFSLLPSKMSSFENNMSVQCMKFECSHSCTSDQNSCTMWQSQNKWSRVSSAWLQKVQTGESIIFCKHNRWPVGKIRYNILYWNHLRQVSSVVLKTLINVAFASSWVFKSVFHFSRHCGESPELTNKV